ncbi:hypothetical protein GCM10017779_13240 [Streptomyces capillispiralis]|nr:hypothetical protein GCM10017779_13240 [Streptomyces capillispiralis]
MARLKSWQLFRRSRISPNRMTVIATAVLTLERQFGCRGLLSSAAKRSGDLGRPGDGPETAQRQRKAPY